MTQTNQPIPNDQFPQEDHERDNEEINATNSATTNDPPSFGWSAYAERINGRFAMIGIAAILLIEALSQETFLHWAGLIQ